MVSVMRFHEISESSHLILNPFSEAKVDLLGEIVGLSPAVRMLDLASGKGEMLCRYSHRFGMRGTGVDVYEPFVTYARDRAVELDVADRVKFEVAEAAAYARTAEPHDVVSCIGATWIGDGTAGTLELIRPIVRRQGFVLLGDVYRMPTGSPESEGHDLPGLLNTFEATGFELVEMVLANRDDWDRYATSQWLNVARWLDANPDDPEAPSVRQMRDESRRDYLQKDRDHMGWGVFVLRPVD